MVRCRHAHRITPIQTTCSISEARLQSAVAQLARQHAAGATEAARPAEQNEAAADEKDSEAIEMRFAVAFRSRTAEPSAACTAQPQGTQLNRTAETPSNGAPADTAGASSAVLPAEEATEAASATDPSCTESQKRRGSSEGADAETTVVGSKEGREEDASRSQGEPLNGTYPSESAKNGGRSCSNDGEAVSLSRERGIAVAAKAFAEGTAQGGAVAVVDLRKPALVLNVDLLPVGGRSICALSIVTADCVSLRPKLAMKQIGSQ